MVFFDIGKCSLLFTIMYLRAISPIFPLLLEAPSTTSASERWCSSWEKHHCCLRAIHQLTIYLYVLPTTGISKQRAQTKYHCQSRSRLVKPRPRSEIREDLGWPIVVILWISLVLKNAWSVGAREQKHMLLGAFSGFSPVRFDRRRGEHFLASRSLVVLWHHRMEWTQSVR